jgi:superfamily II DNA/RNA helicase
VLHYQCPFNAEIYIHRCGRTARIGRDGDCLALLAPEDEKNFKLIAKVLKKPSDAIQMYAVNYTDLKRLEPLIEAAKKFESASHREVRQQKSENWILKTAKDADLDLDDDLRKKIEGGLEEISYKKKNKREVVAPIDVMDEANAGGARHKGKEISKVQQMKEKYDTLKSKEGLKKYGNSSFLTPEAASYLNELMKAGQTSKVDTEIVYAGLHSPYVKEVKFERNMKYKKRYQ